MVQVKRSKSAAQSQVGARARVLGAKQFKKGAKISNSAGSGQFFFVVGPQHAKFAANFTILKKNESREHPRIGKPLKQAQTSSLKLLNPISFHLSLKIDH